MDGEINSGYVVFWHRFLFLVFVASHPWAMNSHGYLITPMDIIDIHGKNILNIYIPLA